MADLGTENSAALVLGGGGLTGIAWMVGLLRGLEHAGAHLRDSRTLIGTSAGSVVAAQLASNTSLEMLFRWQLEGRTHEIAGPRGGFKRMISTVRSAPDNHAAMLAAGQLGLGMGFRNAHDRHRVIEGRLPQRRWPIDRDLRIVAVDADSGERVVFDAGGPAGLLEAVEASAAVPGVWPVVPIDGRRYIDGGTWSPTNADLITDIEPESAVVIAPMPGAMRPGTSAHEQVSALTIPTQLIVPDEQSRKAMGRNALDPARQARAARAGYQQAITEAAWLKPLVEL